MRVLAVLGSRNPEGQISWCPTRFRWPAPSLLSKRRLVVVKDNLYRKDL